MSLVGQCGRSLARSLIRHPLVTTCRSLTHYPVDDRVNGLTDEQTQLRETIFNFCQKELAPHADMIDKLDDFPQRKEFWLKLGDMGLLGITASSEYGGSDMGTLTTLLLWKK